MPTRIFKIRRKFLIPFSIVAVLMPVLLILAFTGKGSALERIVLAAMTLPAAAFFLEARNRRVAITVQGITLRKFLRERNILWQDISHVDCLTIRSKVYLLLTTAGGLVILSNAYGDFAVLIREILQSVSTDKVEEVVRQQAEKPVKNRTDIIALWVAVAIILAMIVMKLMHV